MAGSVPAMSTDGSILLGLAAQNEGELKVVGDEFSEERIGVGYPKEYPEMCEWINETLQKSFDNGDWAEAFESTLGKSGADTPEPPIAQQQSVSDGHQSPQRDEAEHHDAGS